MPFKTFNNWLFDGSRNTPLPEAKFTDDGKVLVPNILKYNSPITHTFVLQLFMKHGLMNDYLNRHFNNINLRYLDKKEFLLFIKKCVLDLKVKKWDTVFYKYGKSDKLFNELRYRLPYLKNDDIELVCELVNKSDDKESIYHTLGLEIPKKKKITLIKKKKKKDKIPWKELLEEQFSIYREESSNN